MNEDATNSGSGSVTQSFAKLRTVVSARGRAYRIGNSALASGDLVAAESRVAFAVEGDDVKPEWIQRLGLIQEKRKKFEEALTTYYRAIGLDSSKAEWFYRAGVCARSLGRQSEANELFEYAVQRSNDHIRAADALANSIPKGLPGWRRMQLLELALGTSQNKKTLREAARLAYSMKRFEETIDYIKRIQDLSGANAGDQVLLGSALASQGQVEKAYQALADAVALGASKEATRYGPGILLDNRREWENAYSVHEYEWGKSGGEDRYAAFRAAYALDRQYRWEASLEWYRRALGSSSDHPAYWAYKFAHALERVGKLDEATSWYSRALDLGGMKQWDWFYRLGYCLHERGLYEVASIALRRWLLKRSDVAGKHGPTVNEATKPSEIGTYSEAASYSSTSSQERSVEMFDFNLRQDSQSLAVEIDSSLDGFKNIALRLRAQARRFFDEGKYKLADLKFGQTYLHSGRTNADLLYEWCETLIARFEFRRVSQLILDHREFFRPDGIDMKNLVESDFDRRKLRYAEYCDRFEVESRTILFESYWGTRINDSPMALYLEACQDSRFANWTFFWTWDGKSAIPDGISDDGRTIIVRYGSAEYDRVLATAGTLINNTSFVQYYSRRENQRYINTWHGTPLKTLGKRIGTGVLEHANVARNLLQVTDLLMPNDYTAGKLCEDYDVSSLATSRVAVVGSPRLDRLVHATEDDRARLLNRLGLTTESTAQRRTVFYAPTWRGSATAKDHDAVLVSRALEILSEFEDLTILYRPHHMINDDLTKIPNGVFVVDPTIDTYDLLQLSDILITDYSSLMFDFLSTDRRVICYVPDILEYREERGLYLEPDQVFSDVAWTDDDLRILLQDKKFVPDTRYLEAKRKYASHEDGRATERVLDIVMDPIQATRTAGRGPAGKRSLVFFESMIPNGIRSSFENLCASLDANNSDITVALDVPALELNADRRQGLENLPETVSVLGRVGSMLVTLEERYALGEFSRNFGVVSPALRELVDSAYSREFKRVFGSPMDTVFLDFEGYSRFWNALLSRGVPDECKSGVFLHNQMGQEASIRFPYLYEIGRNYGYFDGIASVASAIDEGNQEFVRSLTAPPAGGMSVVHNSLDIGAIREAANEDGSLWPVGSDGRLKIVSAGRLSPEKNQVLLIEAMRELLKTHPSALLKVLGDGPSRSSLESAVRSMGLTESIEFCGFVEDPMPTIAGADVFALSSLHEGQPMVIFEAMTVGVPVVSTPVPGCIEAVEMGRGRIVSYDPVEFSRALLSTSLMGDSESFDPTAYNEVAISEFEHFVERICAEGPSA